MKFIKESQSKLIVFQDYFEKKVNNIFTIDNFEFIFKNLFEYYIFYRYQKMKDETNKKLSK